MKHCIVYFLIVFGTVTTTDVVPKNHWARVLQELIDINRQRVDTMLKLYHMQEKNIGKYSPLRTFSMEDEDTTEEDVDDKRKLLVIYVTDKNPIKKYRSGKNYMGLSVNVPPVIKKVNIPEKKTPVKKPVNDKKISNIFEDSYLISGLNLTRSQATMLRKKWFSSCEKKAGSACRRACSDAFKTVCKTFKCKSRMKKAMKKECKSSCKSRFSLGSGKGSGSEDCGGSGSD